MQVFFFHQPRYFLNHHSHEMFLYRQKSHTWVLIMLSFHTVNNLINQTHREEQMSRHNTNGNYGNDLCSCTPKRVSCCPKEILNNIRPCRSLG